MISGLGRIPEGQWSQSVLRRRALLRRLQGQRGLRSADREGGRRAPAPSASSCATPTAGLCREEIGETVAAVGRETDVRLGIHTHNDADTAVAGALAAAQAGATHIQGTINGYGERCGNANLVSIIANLKLKLGVDCVSDDQLQGADGDVPVRGRGRQHAAGPRAALRGLQRLRPQGGPARVRRGQGGAQLSARPPGNGGQRQAGTGFGALGQEQHTATSSTS